MILKTLTITRLKSIISGGCLSRAAHQRWVWKQDAGGEMFLAKGQKAEAGTCSLKLCNQPTPVAIFGALAISHLLKLKRFPCLLLSHASLS
jgi:hypothetical protein